MSTDTLCGTDADKLTRGELVIRTLTMPNDTNERGDIYAGWVMSQMDIGGSILAHNTAQRKVATVAVEAMNFLRPLYVGDLISCYAKLLKIGQSSVNVGVEVWAQRDLEAEEFCVTNGVFTYVAIDENGRPMPIRRNYSTAALG